MTLKQEMSDRSSLIEQNQGNTNSVLNQQRGQIENLENANQLRSANDITVNNNINELTLSKNIINERLTTVSQNTENFIQEQRDRNQNLLQENTDLRRRFTELQQENAGLTERVTRFEAKMRPLSAVFRHPHSNWMPYTATGWSPVTFTHFEGDEPLRGNLSTIEIPEGGMYSLTASYFWRANNNGSTAPYTAIAINNPGNIGNDFVHHHRAQGFGDKGSIKKDVRLRQGDRVMVSIQGSPNAEYFLGHFQFNIEKLFSTF